MTPRRRPPTRRTGQAATTLPQQRSQASEPSREATYKQGGSLSGSTLGAGLQLGGNKGKGTDTLARGNGVMSWKEARTSTPIQTGDGKIRNS